MAERALSTTAILRDFSGRLADDVTALHRENERLREQLKRFVRIDNGTCTDCGGRWLYKKAEIDYATGEHRPWCAIHTIRGGTSAPPPNYPNGTNPVTRYQRGEAVTE